jgi:KDO2-lipid IV(A) lauroyltransferase
MNTFFTRVVYVVFAFVAWLAWTLRIRRGVVEGNLRLAFPEKTEDERKAIARATYRNVGRVAAEFLAIQRATDAEIAGAFEREGWEIYEQARASGRGVLACTAHYGNFEVLAAVNTLQGVPITMISREMGRSRFNDMWRAARAKAGVEDLVVGRGNILQAAIRSMKAGRALGYVIDQNERSRNAVFPTFFGVPAATSPTPAILARRTGAAVIFTVAVPLGGGRHKVVIEGPIEMPDTGDRDADVLAFMQDLNDRLERWVRRHPEQWYWLHRRWKTRPRPDAQPPAETRAPAQLTARDARGT